MNLMKMNIIFIVIKKYLHQLNQKIIEKFGPTNFTGLNLEK